MRILRYSSDYRLVLSLILTFFLPLLMTTGLGAQTLPTVDKTDAPDWLIDRKIPKDVSDRVAEGLNGVAILLSDRQVHWQEDGYTTVLRQSYQVVNRTGLEAASRVLATFDPSQGRLSFHWIRIIRDGQTLDQLDDLDLNVLQREARLESGIWTGAMTAVAELRDVRVGDIVDFAYSYETTNPLIRGSFSDFITPVALQAFGEADYDLLWPRDQPIHIRAIDTEEKVTARKDGKFTRYSWTLRDPEPYEPEDYAPPSQTGPLIALSSMTSWQEVADWARPLFDVDLELPEYFADQVDEIAVKWTTPEDRITELLRLVQDNIRYVAVAIGPGAIVPRTPKRVLELGYGDCKDKSMLLVAMLRRVGIDAAPTLANSLQGKALPKMLPATSVFNHAIVQVRANGQNYWLDPTLFQQGGRFPDITVPEYGYVLPLREGQQDLERIIPQLHAEADLTNTRSYVFNAERDPGLALTVKNHFRYASADAMRALVAQVPKKTLSDSYLEAFAEDIPGLEETADIETEDDRDANIITVTATYESDRKSLKEDDLLSRFYDYFNSITYLLPGKLEDDRSMPIALPRLNAEAIVHLRYEGRTLKPEPDIARAAGPVSFERTSTSDDDGAGVTVHIALKVRQDEAKASLAGDLREMEEFVDDESWAGFSFDSPATVAGVADTLGVEAEIFAPYRRRYGDWLQKYGTTNDPAELRDALLEINELIGEVKRPSRTAGLFDGNKANVLVQMGRTEEALDLMEEAVEQYDGSAQYFMQLAYLRGTSGDTYGATQMLIEGIKRSPDFAFRLPDRMVKGTLQFLDQLSSSDERELRFEFALALAEAGYQLKPATPLGRDLALEAFKGLSERGRGEEAAELLPYISDASALLAALVDRSFEPVWPEIEKTAGEDFALALANEQEQSLAALERDANSLVNLDHRLLALRHQGDLEGAVQAVKSRADRLHSDTNVAYMIGEETDFITHYTDALNDLGRSDEAIAYYKGLPGWDDSRGHVPEAMRLNYAILLLWNGHFEDALKQSEPLTLGRRGSLNEWQLWGLAIQTCANGELGRKKEAESAMDTVDSAYFKSPGAHALALACTENYSKLANVLVQQLDDAGTRNKLLLAFQDYAPSATPDSFEGEIQRRFENARAQPKVQAKVKEVGRIISIASPFNAWQNY